jgi:predicted alpha/beta-hydrolase family hydrolase
VALANESREFTFDREWESPEPHQRFPGVTNEPEKLVVSVDERATVTALLYAAPKNERAGMTVILGHGAGANQLHPFMRLFASGLAARGFDTMTFNFVYMEQGRGAPDPKAKLETCYRAVIDAAQKHKKLKGNRVVIGGKSMGGRIASQVAAESTGLTGLTSHDRSPRAGSPPGVVDDDKQQPLKKVGSKTPTGNEETHEAVDLAGLVFLGYPLHPPGKPEQLRDAHLKEIQVPMLFVQGSRDAFGTTDELRAVIQRLQLPATLYAIEGGDHSLKVSKRGNPPQAEVYEATMDEIARWLQR